MILNVVLVLAVLLVVFLIYVATRPSAFAISRNAVIPVKPDRIFEIVNDFHKWNDWSPWAKLDPNSKTTFGGATSGVGAEFAWDGNGQVGAGRMKITETVPGETIKLDLVFLRPMQATNLTVFTFQPEANGTRVTWTMSGTNGFMGKLFGVFVNCDKMVGDQFEKGFENMKTVLDTGRAAG